VVGGDAVEQALEALGLSRRAAAGGGLAQESQLGSRQQSALWRGGETEQAVAGESELPAPERGVGPPWQRGGAAPAAILNEPNAPGRLLGLPVLAPRGSWGWRS